MSPSCEGAEWCPFECWVLLGFSFSKSMKYVEKFKQRVSVTCSYFSALWSWPVLDALLQLFCGFEQLNFKSFSYIFVPWLQIFHGHQIVSKSKSSIVSWTPAGWHRIFLRANWNWKLCCYRLPSGLGVSANLRVSWAQKGSLEIASSLFLFYFWEKNTSSKCIVPVHQWHTYY